MDTFLFDDFFVGADDPGVEDVVVLNGQPVPMRFKRALTLRDREESKAKAVTTAVGADGSLNVTGVDEGVFTVEVLMHAIKSWPFTYQDGSPVPVTRENIHSMMASGADALQQKVLELASPKREALAPFVKPSDAA